MHDPQAAVDDAMHDPRPLPTRQNAECSLNHWHQDPCFCTSTTTPTSSSTLSTLAHPAHLPHQDSSLPHSFRFDSIFVSLTLLFSFYIPTSHLLFPVLDFPVFFYDLDLVPAFTAAA